MDLDLELWWYSNVYSPVYYKPGSNVPGYVSFRDEEHSCEKSVIHLVTESVSYILLIESGIET